VSGTTTPPAPSVSKPAVVLRAGQLSFRVERRTVWVCVALGCAALALGFAGLSYGTGWTAPSQVVAALFGQGDSSLVITQWRAPRVAAALIFGASLGVAGAIFQNLTRNPLGSPDVIGLDEGAYTGALIAITVFSGTAVALAVSSVLGGLIAALAIYLLSLKTGFSGLRLVVIGIAVNAMLVAVNSWIVLRAELEVAMAATGWSVGSLNGIDWQDVLLPFAIIAVLFGWLYPQWTALHQTALGDEVAITSGVDLNRHRLLLVLIGVGCTATVTAVAGPIIFVALAAPQIGRRLAGTPGVSLLPAALTGAVLLISADLIAQWLLAPVSPPVGVVTTVIGGCYLIWLLIREVRR